MLFVHVERPVDPNDEHDQDDDVHAHLAPLLGRVEVTRTGESYVHDHTIWRHGAVNATQTSPPTRSGTNARGARSTSATRQRGSSLRILRAVVGSSSISVATFMIMTGLDEEGHKASYPSWSRLLCRNRVPLEVFFVSSDEPTKKPSEPPSRLGMRVGGALYVAVAAWSAYQTHAHAEEGASRSLGPAAVQALIGIALAVGPERVASTLKDVLALLIGGAAAARSILTGMMLATDTPFAYAFTEPREAVPVIGVALAMLLLLVGRAGSLRVTFGLLVLVGSIYLGVVLPPLDH